MIGTDAALAERIRQVDWSKYQTAYGPAHANRLNYVIPDLLIGLLNQNEEEASMASHHLWCSICHQGCMSSAALPALPFLLEIFDKVSDKLKVEILDIFHGWVMTTCEDGVQASFMAKHGWLSEVRDGLKANLSKFKSLMDSQEKDIAEFSKDIVEMLESGRVDPLPSEE